MIHGTLNSVDIPLSDVARATAMPQAEITRLLATGILGAAPASTSAAKIPLFHLSALLVLQDAEKLGVSIDRAAKIITSIAGAAYIGLAQNALRQGLWVAGRGSPARTSELCSLLQSARGVSFLEERLPCCPIRTKQFAGFSQTNFLLFDKWEEVNESEWPLKVISSTSIARRVNLAFPGKLFSTDVS